MRRCVPILTRASDGIPVPAVDKFRLQHYNFHIPKKFSQSEKKSMARARPKAATPLPKGDDDRPDSALGRSDTPKQLKSSVQSLAKGFRVLEAFSAAEEE